MLVTRRGDGHRPKMVNISNRPVSVRRGMAVRTKRRCPLRASVWIDIRLRTPHLTDIDLADRVSPYEDDPLCPSLDSGPDTRSPADAGRGSWLQDRHGCYRSRGVWGEHRACRAAPGQETVRHAAKR